MHRGTRGVRVRPGNGASRERGRPRAKRPARFTMRRASGPLAGGTPAFPGGMDSRFRGKDGMHARGAVFCSGNAGILADAGVSRPPGHAAGPRRRTSGPHAGGTPAFPGSATGVWFRACGMVVARRGTAEGLAVSQLPGARVSRPTCRAADLRPALVLPAIPAPSFPRSRRRPSRGSGNPSPDSRRHEPRNSRRSEDCRTVGLFRHTRFGRSALPSG